MRFGLQQKAYHGQQKAAPSPTLPRTRVPGLWPQRDATGPNVRGYSPVGIVGCDLTRLDDTFDRFLCHCPALANQTLRTSRGGRNRFGQCLAAEALRRPARPRQIDNTQTE